MSGIFVFAWMSGERTGVLMLSQKHFNCCTIFLAPLFFGLDLCSSRILWPYRLCCLLAFQSGMPTDCYFLGACSERCMCEQPCSMRRPARCQRLFPQWYTEVARLARGFRDLGWQSRGTDPEAGTAGLPFFSVIAPGVDGEDTIR